MIISILLFWDNLFSRSSLYFVVITSEKVAKTSKNRQYLPKLSFLFQGDCTGRSVHTFVLNACFSPTLSISLIRAGWINLKTLLDKTFRLFVNQKVSDMGVIGGKIQLLFPWKLGNWLGASHFCNKQLYLDAKYLYGKPFREFIDFQRFSKVCDWNQNRYYKSLLTLLSIYTHYIIGMLPNW